MRCTHRLKEKGGAGANLLDVLLAVQQQAKHGTQELLGALSGRKLLQVLLQLDRTKVRQ